VFSISNWHDSSCGFDYYGLATVLPLLRLNIVNCYVVCIKTSDALFHGSFTSFVTNKGIKLIIMQDYKWIWWIRVIKYTIRLKREKEKVIATLIKGGNTSNRLTMPTFLQLCYPFIKIIICIYSFL
jgi:hypothetical protein